MNSVSLLQLRTDARQKSDMETSQFVSDSELTRYINQSASELYDLIIASYEDYDISSVQIVYSTDDGYTLPSDFYKLRGVDFQAGSDWVVVNPFNFLDRNLPNITAVSRYPTRQYRIVGNKIKFVPLGESNGTYRLWYIPSFAQLVSDTDTTSLSFEGWDEYIAVDAAIKCLQKEESDVSVLMAQKEQLKARIMRMAAGRDAGQPECVSDVRKHSDSRWW